MKKLMILILILCLFLCSCSKAPSPTAETLPKVTSEYKTAENSKALKAVWVSYKDLQTLFEENPNESVFTSRVLQMISNVKDLGLNTVIVHTRAFSDAFYESDIFPWSKYITGTEGKSIGYDPFKIICDTAAKENIDVEAWINPYRVSLSTDFTKLSDNNPAKIWYNQDKNTDRLIICDKGIYYNPASVVSQSLVIDGIREIITKYKVSAIHLDDYFYPSTDEKIDEKNFAEYTKGGGTLSLASWRRENVNSLISGIYSAVKTVNKDIDIVISPDADIDKNYNNFYADIKMWLTNDGFVDMIMPQIYFGFNNSSMPFSVCLDKWISLTKNTEKALVIGLAFYKCGAEDKFAGNGKNEWIESSDIISRQVTKILSNSTIYGFSLFSYNYIFQENITKNAKNELQILKSML